MREWCNTCPCFFFLSVPLGQPLGLCRWDMMPSTRAVVWTSCPPQGQFLYPLTKCQAHIYCCLRFQSLPTNGSMFFLAILWGTLYASYNTLRVLCIAHESLCGGSPSHQSFCWIHCCNTILLHTDIAYMLRQCHKQNIGLTWCLSVSLKELAENRSHML